MTTHRNLLADAEKRSRDLIDKVSGDWLERLVALRDLSRPNRTRTNYPKLATLHQALEKVLTLHEDLDERFVFLIHELEEIRDQARGMV